MRKWMKMMGLLCVAAALGLPGTARAEVYEDEEWYDPGDWFDGDNYDYEAYDDGYTYGEYGYGYYWDEVYDKWVYGYHWETEGSDLDDYYYDWDYYDEYGYYDVYDDEIYDAYAADDQSRQDQQQQAQEAMEQKDLMTVSGQIERIGRVKIRDVDSEHVMVKLSTDDEDQPEQFVDLGPTRELTNQVELDTGQQITVMGSEKSMEDKSVLIAEMLKIDDRTVDIQENRRKEYQRIQWQADRKEKDKADGEMQSDY